MSAAGIRDAAGGDTPHLATAYLSPPQLGPATVVRPRLLAALTEGAAMPITIVSGEPASGKTSLLVQWMATVDGRVAWLSVPRNLDDEVRFWEYVLTAVARCGVRVDDLRSAAADGEQPTDDWTTALANRLGEGTDRLVVVIDDLQELEASHAIATLGELLEIIPVGVSFVIATRVIPSWPLAGWRVSGRLAEIGGRELAITVDEAHELFASSCVVLGDDEVVRLVERTEGWLGGIRLATLALQRAADPAEFVARFAGDDELVSSYLLRAVVERQDDEIRGFLHDISIFDTISTTVCDEIRQSDDSAELLERCRSANLFVSRLAGGVGSYRLHALLRELLHADLERQDRDRFVSLHHRASLAFEESGDVEGAVIHATRAGDVERASELVIAHAPGLAHRGRFDELRRLSTLVKRSGARETSATILALAASLVFAGQGAEALPLLDELDELPTSAEQEEFGGLLRCAALLVCGHVHLLRESGQRFRLKVTELSRGGRQSSVGNALFIEGVGTFMEGELDAAAERLELADRPENRPLPPSYIAVRSWAALVALRRGDITDAEYCVHIALDRRDELSSGDTAAIAVALLTSAEIAWEQDRLDEAAALFTRARRSVQPMPWQAVLVECARSRLTVSRGEPNQALEDLTEIGKLVLSGAGSRLLRAVIAERAVDICVRTGDVDAALGWAHTHEQCQVGELPWASRIRLGKAVDRSNVDDLVAEALSHAEPIPGRIDTLLVAAVCSTDDVAARSLVAEALGLAEPGRMIRRFVDAGPRVAPLVGGLSEDPRRSGGVTFSRFFAGEVLDACAKAGAQRTRHRPAVDGLVDQLSAREIEVLQLLATGMSYTEMGSELFVSRNTIKSHVQHVYTKLGVAGRARAVELGRELELI